MSDLPITYRRAQPRLLFDGLANVGGPLSPAVKSRLRAVIENPRTRPGRTPTPSCSGRRGSVRLTSTRTVPGIAIGVLPSNHLTQTQQDGTFSMVIPKQTAKGITYQAVVYMPNSNPPAFHLGVVKFDADGEGTFDHTLGGGR